MPTTSYSSTLSDFLSLFLCLKHRVYGKVLFSMQIFRFLFIVFLTLILASIKVKKPYLKFLNPQNHTSFEKTKWLFTPLLIQTMVEYPLRTYLAYLPTRLCMTLISLISFYCLSSLFQFFFHDKHKYIDIIIYFFALTLGFMFEDYYLAKGLTFHMYDPIFAMIALLFLILIYILKASFL